MEEKLSKGGFVGIQRIEQLLFIKHPAVSLIINLYFKRVHKKRVTITSPLLVKLTDLKLSLFYHYFLNRGCSSRTIGYFNCIKPTGQFFNHQYIVRNTSERFYDAALQIAYLHIAKAIVIFKHNVYFTISAWVWISY